MKYPAGFTLVEMAIVLVIVGLLLGGLLMPLSAQVDQRRISETQKALDEIKDAMIGYAASHVDANNHPYLPCPDKTTAAGAGVANDGQEDRNAGTTCVTPEGNVPWVTLGTAQTDSWGNRFHYRVSTNIAQNSTTLVNRSFSSSTNGITLDITTALTLPTDLMRICPVAACTAALAIADNVPAIILSYGKNGYGAINAAGNANPAPTGADELANTNSDAIFVSRTPSDTSATGGEFDDIVTWLSPNILFNRMVAAGQLP